MGQQGSRVASALTPTAAENASQPIDVTERLSLAAPSAAVIGAGVAGVHVAYELAKMGFQVTVFERRSEIAGGETRFALPFVGVGLIEPALARATLRSEVLRGVLLPTTCPDLIAREHLFHTVMNPVVYRWMWGRLRSCFTDKEVMCYTNNLSRVSHGVVRDLVSKYPHLQEHVSTAPVTVLNERKEVAATAHGEPFMVDPVGWTKAMADVCRTHFNVKFALGERLEDTNTYLKYNVESMKSIRVSKADPLTPDQRIFASEVYDVVVLAAGSSTGTMTLPNSRLPVLGLSGLAAHVQQPSGALKDALWSLFQRKASSRGESDAAGGETGSSSGSSGAASLSRPAPGTLALLSSKCSLYAYTWPSCAAAASHIGEKDVAGVASMVHSKVLPTAQDYILQGLLSLDTTQRSRTDSLIATQLERLESYVRMKSGSTVPLCSPAAFPRVAQDAAHQHEAERANSVHVNEYVRAFTPDGVPLIDHNGGAFNCFVCCGFGDHAMDFAPGAAKVLGKLVNHQAQKLREEDLENVKTWGVLTSKLTPSRRAEVEADLQSLFNGIVPSEAASTQGSLSAVQAAADLAAKANDGEGMLHFEMNPFSTNRFRGLVPKEVKDTTAPSWLDRFNAMEDRLLARIEPHRQSFHRKLVRMAEQDNVPSAVRNFVFCYFYDESNDPEAVARKLQQLEHMRKLVEKYEAPAARAVVESGDSSAVAKQGAEDTAGLSPAERSRRKQAEMERQARELFSKL